MFLLAYFRVFFNRRLGRVSWIVLVDLFLSKNYNMWMLSSLKVPECRGITYFLRFDQHPTTVRSSKVAIFGL